ncbi:hypothetical protein [Novosphingobium sp. Leaf2]|uniref:hypothetical protein n=1 Tax=Novosphingobium sp. Leaf2 TaxID=1735670 RepID=UPI000B0FD4B7|nr:hypothetical protein [Novosphingobium sp. Leaf2]
MRALAITIVAFAGCVASHQAFAQTPPDVSDLVGARGAGGETQLEARGYRFVTTNTVRDTKWSFWWSERQRQCISVATSDGRYASIITVPAANCRTAADTSGARAYAPQANGGARIDLVCIGAGTGPATQSTSDYRYNSKTRKFEYGRETTLGRAAFSADAEIEISGESGRIRLAGPLVSPIHSGGSDGWWPISGLMVTPDRITGQYRMNGLNKPRIDYNRRTRVLHIQATTEFTGRCEEQ